MQLVGGTARDPSPASATFHECRVLPQNLHTWLTHLQITLLVSEDTNLSPIPVTATATHYTHAGDREQQRC